MKLCFVSLQARGALIDQPGQKIGGAERQIAHLARYCAVQPGAQVSVIVEDVGQPDIEVAEGVRLVKIHQPASGRGAAARTWRKGVSALALLRTLWRLRPDVIIQRCAGVETGLAAMAGHRLGSRFVYMAANDFEFEPPFSTDKHLMPKLFRYSLKKADHIFVQHAGQQASLKAAHKLESELLQNVFPFDFSAPIARATARLLWLGRGRPHKQPEKFIELARRVAPLPCTMVLVPGEGDAAYFAATEKAARGVSNLEFIGGLPPSQIPAQFARASVLVNTAAHEGMPNIFLEAAQYGAAIVALHVDPAGMLNGEGCGICTRGDFAALVTAVEHLARNERERQTLVERARRVLGPRHSIAVVGPQFFGRLAALATGVGRHPQ